jgi:glucuronate isomerase
MSAEENKMRMGIAWEEKYAELKGCVEMPERGTPLYNWIKTQLSNGPFGLNAKIRKEIAENEGSTVWSERRVKLSDCVEQKNQAKIGNAWEKRYAEFVTGCRRKEPRYILGNRMS